MRFFDSARCYIIVDIGGNFVDVEMGIKLVDAAAEAGVDAVKLQTYKAETLCAVSAVFDMENTGCISQFNYFKKHELSEEDHRVIFLHSQKHGLDWFSTPSHPEDADMLDRLDVPCYKVGADDALNIPFLENLAQRGKPIILSSGLCIMSEVHAAVDCILKKGNKQIAILHAVSGYPTHPEHVNLNAMLSMQREFPYFPVGFSDHSLGIWASLAAATMGARIIERHLTLDKNADGPDHILSSDPAEIRELVRQVRHMELLCGSSVKQPYGPEVHNRINNRKSLVVTQRIRRGEIFTTDNIWPKRPGTGLGPELFYAVVGKSATRDLEPDTVLVQGDIQ
jgi:N-acetylneuraminate synthase